MFLPPLKPYRIASINIGMCVLDPSTIQSAAEYMAQVESALIIARKNGVVYTIGTN